MQKRNFIKNLFGAEHVFDLIFVFSLSALCIGTIVLAKNSKYYNLIQSVRSYFNIENDMGGSYKISHQYFEFYDTYRTIGNNDNPFTGELDGQGVTITLINCTSNADCTALFGCNYGIIKNVNFYLKTNSSFSCESNNSFISFLCARNYGQIINCNITVISTKIKANGHSDCLFGGIATYNNGLISNCKVNGTAVSDNVIIGENTISYTNGPNSSIENCSSNLKIIYETT